MVNPVLAETIRSGLVESVHRGRVAITDPDGALEFALGDVDAPIYPRSATKPLLAVGMLELGLDLDGQLLALTGSSHSGEPMHIAAAEEILTGAGLTIVDLSNTPALPSDVEAMLDWVRSGHGKESVSQNCSGKHASMVRTCVRNGWPTASYLDLDHPLQVALTATMERLTGEAPHIGVDGCGAPAHTMSTTALARTYGRIAAAKHGPEFEVAEAFRAHPDFASGTRRWESLLHRAVPGLFCKYGAEGVLGIGLSNGQGIAIKVDDGADRVLPVVAVEALGLLGIRSEELTRIGGVPVLGHGEPVGEIVSTLTD